MHSMPLPMRYIADACPAFVQCVNAHSYHAAARRDIQPRVTPRVRNWQHRNGRFFLGVVR
jgi:hypothetical protein